MDQFWSPVPKLPPGKSHQLGLGWKKLSAQFIPSAWFIAIGGPHRNVSRNAEFSIEIPLQKKAGGMELHEIGTKIHAPELSAGRFG
jgi:hypothetical protein